EAIVDAVGETGVDRPGEARLVAGGGELRAGGQSVEGGQAVVAEVGEMVFGHTDAGTDERRDAPPRAEIDVGVGEEHEARQVGPVVVDIAEGSTEGAELPVYRPVQGRHV